MDIAFGQLFWELRHRRRIPMRGFERAGVPSSYINAIEKQGLVPSAEKLTAIAEIFAAVANEQGAADPEEDARRLFAQRDRVVFEREQLPAALADAMDVARAAGGGGDTLLRITTAWLRTLDTRGHVGEVSELDADGSDALVRTMADATTSFLTDRSVASHTDATPEPSRPARGAQ